VVHGENPPERRSFSLPSRLSMFVVQLIWFFIGTRINCFTIAGIKRG
jgi:hypothetical protein